MYNKVMIYLLPLYKDKIHSSFKMLVRKYDIQ